MALIKCPECGKEVSDKADTCPNCASPVGGGGTTQAHGGKVQTVEQTSKRYKLQLILSTLLIIVGLIILISGACSSNGGNSILYGFLSFSGGLIWLIITRFKIWWHHK